jgi:hypothetical protein
VNKIGIDAGSPDSLSDVNDRTRGRHPCQHWSPGGNWHRCAAPGTGARLNGMELIAMVLLPFPLGYFLAKRSTAFVAYIAAYSFIFTFQTMMLLRAWVGGDTSAFQKNPNSIEWSYGLLNLVFYAAGLGLVWLGHRVAARRRAKLQPADSLSR